MSNFSIDIIDRPIFYLSIDTTVGIINNTIEIEKYNDYNLELINTEKILASDLPDDIPISKIVGNLSVDRIDGLDEYLSSFASIDATNVIGLNDYLDGYEFDCGTP